jgi:hypothetical protein
MSDAWLFWRAPHIGGPPPAAPDKQTVRQVTPLLEGFKTKITVTVPGRITQTSASKTERTTSTWTFDFDRNGGALLDLQYQPFRIDFSPTSKATLNPVSYAGKSLLPRTSPQD